MSVVNPSTVTSDSWDYIPPGQPLLATRRAQVIPDDWDADEDEEDEPQRLWENANKNAPMPELVIASTSTTSSAVPPPPAAFQPSLRILKRPSASPTPSSQSSSTDAQKSYAEREAQYQAARERIFGGESTSPSRSTPPSERNRKLATRSSGSTPERSIPVSSTIIRNPRGPESVPQDPSRTRDPNIGGDGRGFASRRGGVQKGSSGQEPQTQTPPG